MPTVALVAPPFGTDAWSAQYQPALPSSPRRKLFSLISAISASSPTAFCATPRENIIAGTDCGLGGRVHAGLVWVNLRKLVEGARLASTSLWP